MSFAANIAKCHPCSFRGPARGSCLCLGDKLGHDIIDKAHSDQCPKRKFGTVENVVELKVTAYLKARYRPTYAIADDYQPEHEVRRLRAGGCCGSPTQPG